MEQLVRNRFFKKFSDTKCSACGTFWEKWEGRQWILKKKLNETNGNGHFRDGGYTVDSQRGCIIRYSGRVFSSARVLPVMNGRH